MRRPIGNTIHSDDFADIYEGINVIKSATRYFQSRGAIVEIPHVNRYWEYGTGIQILLDHYREKLPDIEVLDIGSGNGAIGPALSLHYNTKVTECEPLPVCRDNRKKCNDILRQANKKEMELLAGDLFHLPKKQYDVVLCISVLEHVTKLDEPYAWGALAERVKPGGILYITCDCMSEPEKPHMYDELRETNYCTKDLEFRISVLSNLGFATMGRPDYTYNGNQVFDYSFFRVGLLKTEI